MRNYTNILNEGFNLYFKKLNESNELKEYEVEVRFGGFIGVEEIYTVSAYNEDEAHREALSEAAWDLNVESVENSGDDEYEVSITFGGYVGSEQYYTVYAEDDSEAEDAALDLAADDFEVLSVEELMDESFTRKLEESQPFNFSSAARRVAEMAVRDFTKGPEAREFKQELMQNNEGLPIDKIMDNLCQVVYSKYFNAYKRPNRGADYLEPFSSEEDMVDYYLKYDKAEDFWVDGIKYRNGKLFVQIATKFIDYVMYSYYVIYDEKNPDKAYACRRADFNANI